MKILLDENLPRKLKFEFREHEVFTVRDMQWSGIKNGELLSRAVSNNFKVFITGDTNIQFQQNISKFPITIFLLRAKDNRYSTLRKLVPIIFAELERTLEFGIKEIS